MNRQPRLIAFEGVDGSGKSTVIKLVAETLRGRGVPVFMPRMGKEHDSRPTRMIRRLTRDPRNLTLSPRAELNLYCAREAQVLTELVEPALARGETVLLDRSLLTPVVLGSYGRGVERGACEAAARLAAGGREPDLTVIFDVHPRTSKIRKRIDKVRTHAFRDGGRKGLAGSALKERVRAGYLELARERGYPLFQVERVTPVGLAEKVMGVVDGGPAEQTPLEAQPYWQVPEQWTLGQALASMPTAMALYLSRGLVSGRALRREAVSEEPQLVAWALDRRDPLREQAVQCEPDYALKGLVRRPLERDDVREKLLDQAPGAVASALRFVAGERADAIRERLAEAVPGAVLSSLVGREDEWAWVLRRRLWEKAVHQDQSASLVHCRGEEAARYRESLFASWPVHGITSLRGAPAELSDPWLLQYVDYAPKAVLRALMGRTDPPAHEMRLRLLETGREVVDSIRGQTDAASWSLRERTVDRWPSTVAWSLAGVPESPRRRALLERCQAAGRGDVHLLRRLQDLEEYKKLPSWARTRDGLDDID